MVFYGKAVHLFLYPSAVGEQLMAARERRLVPFKKYGARAVFIVLDHPCDRNINLESLKNILSSMYLANTSVHEYGIGKF